MNSAFSHNFLLSIFRFRITRPVAAAEAAAASAPPRDAVVDDEDEFAAFELFSTKEYLTYYLLRRSPQIETIGNFILLRPSFLSVLCSHAFSYFLLHFRRRN